MLTPGSELCGLCSQASPEQAELRAGGGGHFQPPEQPVLRRKGPGRQHVEMLTTAHPAPLRHTASTPSSTVCSRSSSFKIPTASFPGDTLKEVESLSRVRLFATPRTAALQASLSITNSWSLLKLMSIESVMPSNHLILCHPLLLLPPTPPSIRVFSKESVLCNRWPKYWSFSFSISPSSEYSGLISFRMDWFDLLAVQGTLKSFIQTTAQKHQIFSAQVSLWSNSHIHT